MKIRLDYVTNSSSSSFIVQMNIETKEGSVCFNPYYEEGMECEDCFSSCWNGSFKDILKIKDKDELFNYISSKFCNNSWYYEENPVEGVELDKEEFDAVVKSVDDIERIVVRTDYSAWGEYADLVADNDETLLEFAREYKNAKTEEEKNVILGKVYDYIDEPKKDLCGEEFGTSVDEFYYYADGDGAIIRTLERLTTGYGPGDVEGYEEVVYDLKGNKISSKAVFYLH